MKYLSVPAELFALLVTFTAALYYVLLNCLMKFVVVYQPSCLHCRLLRTAELFDSRSVPAELFALLVSYYIQPSCLNTDKRLSRKHNTP